MKILYMAHSGIRYLVILAAVLAIVGFILGFASSRGPGGAVSAGRAKLIRIFGASFVGVLDLQVLLGILLVVFMVAAGLYYPALIGHIVMMFLAAVIAHVGSVIGRKRTGPSGYVVQLGSVFGALALIVGGIMAIGRGVMQTIPYPY